MKLQVLMLLTLAAGVVVSSCSSSDQKKNSENPLFSESTLPLHAPEFNKIKPEHYRPAFKEGMKRELKEMKEIAGNSESPTFKNTIVAMEKSGRLLSRTSSVFYNLTSANTSDKIQEIQKEMAPKLASHSDDIYLNSSLYDRVNTLYKKRDELDLTNAEVKLLKDTHRQFVRSGAQLDEEKQKRLRKINEKLSSLTTEFQDKLLESTKNRSVLVKDKSKLDGLSDDRLAAAKEAANDNDKDGYVLGISNTTRVPVLKQLNNRDLRKRVWKASAYRATGQDGDVDTRPLIKKIVKLRAERAELLGYENHAAYKLAPQTAKNPDNALDLLGKIIPPVLKNTKEEKANIKEMMVEDGVEGKVQPWDWNYYAEKVRQKKYDIDQSKVRPYFELDKVLHDGVFFAMNKLYGVTFKERNDLPVYHPDVRTFDVIGQDGEQIGLYYVDFFSRDSKRGGAWMNSYVSQSSLLDHKPVIVNVLNISKSAEGEPALIPFENVTTMFHEMGHAMHGLLSDNKYPSQGGTSVPRDYVEFPSTFNEGWATLPEVLKNYAVHYKTGEQIPQELLDKVIEASNFNEGFNTQEYMAATMLDMEWHLLGTDEIPNDVQDFEHKALAKHNLDDKTIPPRYKSPYFQHTFSGGYSANYYSYMWSDVLASDAFAYMKENGGLTRENGKRFRKYILSKGGSEEAMKLYKEYRGQEPDVKHVLKSRGLDTK